MISVCIDEYGLNNIIKEIFQMQKIVIFGTGELAQRIFFYLKNSEDEVVAFSANKSNIDSNELFGLPVVAFEVLKKNTHQENFLCLSLWHIQK